MQFEFDESFLEKLGLGQMPPREKDAFLEHIIFEFELRVGTKLSEGLSDAQLEEFEAFIDQYEPVVVKWLERNAPNYEEDPEFIRLKREAPSHVSHLALISEYASLRWLTINTPNYRDLIAAEKERLSAEIAANVGLLLGPA